MDTKAILFGFGVGAILVSAFLFVIFLIDSQNNTDNAMPIAQMSDQDVVAKADELITEARDRGIHRYIDISVINDILPTPAKLELTDEEIIARAYGLDMIFPTIPVEIAPELETPSPTPIPTDTPTPTPEPTATPTPEPTAAPPAEDEGDTIYIHVPQGASSDEISRLLEYYGVIPHAPTYNQYIIEQGKSELLRFGDLYFPKDSRTKEDILDIITW